MSEVVKYPVGEQSFENLRKGGFLYVDKTQYIEKLVKGSQYYFLGRPRRFGKSLFLSTLKSFFEGKRELFRGLHIDSMDWDWEPYPVIVLDFNDRRYKEERKIDLLLEEFLSGYESKYGIEKPDTDFSGRFGNLIVRIAEKTGKNVVVLVDEYDKALVNNIHDHEKLEYFRDQLAEIYSHFKSKADYLRFVFITGVSRFGKLSIFSAFNSPRDISMVPNFAAICGITEEELLWNFKEGISALGERFGKSDEKIVAELKKRYDGYHFTEDCPDIYNPFSLLNVFANIKYDNYWISSGTPTLLLEQLKRTNADLEILVNTQCKSGELTGLDITNINPPALFFQTGYLTIKSYNERRNTYKLGIPNQEVREGFYEFILPSYANLKSQTVTTVVNKLLDDFEAGEVDGFMKRLQSFFSGTNYDLKIEEEKDVRNAMFILFNLIGLYVDAEYRTSEGRIDILVRTDDFVYIMELKFNRSAREALDQILEKNYALPWTVDDRKVIAVGINFSTKRRTIDEWLPEPIVG